MAWVACTVSVSAWSQLSIHSAWRLDIAWWTYTVPLYDLSYESPGSMTLVSGVRVLYCTLIWSQLSLQASWHWDLMWRSCTVPLYDLSWVSSKQHDVRILHEWLALYLYMISAESPGNMTLGYAVIIIVEEKVLSRIMRGSYDHLEQCSRPHNRWLQTDENTWKWLVPSIN